MDQNPYQPPTANEVPPRAWSAWAKAFVAGLLIIGLGVLAVVAAHMLAPRQYAFIAIALTEKIVLLGLLVSLVGGIGWGTSWMLVRRP